MMTRSWLKENKYFKLSDEALREKARSLGVLNPENYVKGELIKSIGQKKAANPNTSPEQLFILSYLFPEEVFNNKAFFLVLVEQPDFYQQIINNYLQIDPSDCYSLLYYLRENDRVPVQFQKTIIIDFSDSGIIFKQFLLDNPNLDNFTLELTIDRIINAALLFCFTKIFREFTKCTKLTLI